VLSSRCAGRGQRVHAAHAAAQRDRCGAGRGPAGPRHLPLHVSGLPCLLPSAAEGSGIPRNPGPSNTGPCKPTPSGRLCAVASVPAPLRATSGDEASALAAAARRTPPREVRAGQPRRRPRAAAHAGSQPSRCAAVRPGRPACCVASRTTCCAPPDSVLYSDPVPMQLIAMNQHS
jgi:hypothetical protein